MEEEVKYDDLVDCHKWLVEAETMIDNESDPIISSLRVNLLPIVQTAFEEAKLQYCKETSADIAYLDTCLSFGTYPFSSVCVEPIVESPFDPIKHLRDGGKVVDTDGLVYYIDSAGFVCFGIISPCPAVAGDMCDMISKPELFKPYIKPEGQEPEVELEDGEYYWCRLSGCELFPISREGISYYKEIEVISKIDKPEGIE